VFANEQGSGHHGLIPVIRDMPGIHMIQKCEQLLTDFWDPTVSIQRRNQIYLNLLAELQEGFDKCVSESTDAKTGCSHFILFGKWNFFSYP
jgi:hypothetical protein